MESFESGTPAESPEPKVELDRPALRNLYEAGGWAYFLSILGFIMVGFLLLVGALMGVIFSNMPEERSLPFSGAAFSLLYGLIALIYIFPIYYLFKFASEVRKGASLRDSQQVGSALHYLKSHYKIVGILAIVGIGLYILAVFLILAFGMGNMMGNTMNA